MALRATLDCLLRDWLQAQMPPVPDPATAG